MTSKIYTSSVQFKNMKWQAISILLFTFFLSIGYSQNPDIKNIVFEGAGIRGIAYTGAVQSLEQKSIINNVEKVGGTSAGAIIALLISLEYTSEELTTIISNTKFQKFNDGRFFFIGGFSRTKNRYGWYRGQKFTNWIGNLIKEKTGNSEITFEQLYQKGYKDLYLTATCLNQQKLVILSRETYPKMKIKDAVRISMSIPLYYQAVFVDKNGKIYSKPKKDESLDIMVDGGIIGNFPIQIFDTIIVDSLKKVHRIPNYETIGFRIDTEKQIQEDSTTKDLAPFTIHNFKDYVSAFYIMVIENLNRQQLTKDDWDRTISISSVGISPKVKKLSEEQKQKLIESGKHNTEVYLKKLYDKKE